MWPRGLPPPWLCCLMTLLLLVSIAVSGCGNGGRLRGKDVSYDDYEEVTGKVLIDALESNAAKASKVLTGKKLKIIGGKLDTIDSDGTQFTLDCGELFMNTIHCSLKDSSVAQKQLYEFQKGQPITVYGTVENVGEILGYFVEVDCIEATNGSMNANQRMSSGTANSLASDKTAVIDAVNKFMNAYVHRNRSGILASGYCEGQTISQYDSLDIIDKQVEVLDLASNLMKQTGQGTVKYDWRIQNVERIDADTYQADIILLLLPDSMDIPSVTIKKINNDWKVDIESFAVSSGASFVTPFLQQ